MPMGYATTSSFETSRATQQSAVTRPPASSRATGRAGRDGFRSNRIRNDGRDSAVEFTVKGMHLKGGLKVGSDRFSLNLDVPFLLRPLKGRAFAVIE